MRRSCAYRLRAHPGPRRGRSPPFVNAGAFYAAGLGGQLVEVVPDRDLVVVVQTEINPLGDGSEGLDTSKLTFMVGDVIAPAAR